MIKALLWTIIIECLVIYIFRERDFIFYIYWAAVTSFTNLALNLILSLLFSEVGVMYYLTVILLEIIVVVGEYLLCNIYLNDKVKSIKYSVICNLTSFLVGLIIMPIF